MAVKRKTRAYENRWARVRDHLKSRKLRAYVSSSPHNLRYLCCAHTPSGPIVNHVIIPVKGEPVAITSSLEEFRARSECAVTDIRIFSGYRGIPADGRDPVGLVKKVFRERGIDGAKAVFDTKLGGIRSRVDPLVTKMRAVKDDGEIAAIRKACRATDASARKLRSQLLRPGRMETHVGADLDCLLRHQGGVQKNSFDTIIASGGHAAFSHHDNSVRRIGKNDTVICDFGVYADGYVSDLTRTYSTGSPKKELRKIHELVLRSQQDAIDRVELGIPYRDIDMGIRDMFRKEGYDRYFVHGTGHGIGLEVHEGPTVNARSADTITAGHVFTIEPGIYVPGLGGVRIEDDVMIDSRGKVTVLTKSTRAL